MNSKKYKAVILGAGRIASGYDTPRSKTMLTHAHALVSNPRVDLVGIFDTDSVRGEIESRKWKTKFWDKRSIMFEEVIPDIIVIATPSETHKDLLIESFKVKPRVIIVEKPIVNEKSEMAIVRRAGEKAEVPVIVNFRRRFDTTVCEVRDALINGEYGSILSAYALYSKGVLHNGSHMIDLARYLFGEMTGAKAHFQVNDFPQGEPSLGGIATFERCSQFYLMAGDERSFYVFEMTIITEKCRIRFFNEGRELSIEMVVQDTLYPEDRILGPAKVKKTMLAEAMTCMVEHAVRVADGKERSRSSLEDALRTQESCYTLLSSLKKY